MNVIHYVKRRRLPGVFSVMTLITAMSLAASWWRLQQDFSLGKEGVILVVGSNMEKTALPPPSMATVASLHSLSRNASIIPVQSNDYIYSATKWGASPIVVPSHKLVFFEVTKVGCTIFKRLFRRMMGLTDWKNNSNLHYPRSNGLVYLNQYSLLEATAIMNDPTYTRAIMVRDPKERFLSAFLDKAVANHGTFLVLACCYKKEDTCRNATFADFLNLTQTCHNPHWNPQAYRIDHKFWSTLNFVGHMENIQEDTKKLLQHIGAWEDFGQSGWGTFGNESIFASKSDIAHATSQGDSWNNLLPRYYTPELELAVEERYQADYSSTILGLEKKKIHF